MNPSRFLSFFILCCLFSLSAVADASLLQAPHRLEQGITCATCHQYPLSRWQGYVKDPGNIDDTVINFICLGCHGPSGSAPKMKLHSSQVIAGRVPNWTTQCIDCHDPHVQGQLHNFAVDGDSLYLVIGQYVGATVNYAANPAQITSTIRYQAATAVPGWEFPIRWTAKTGVAGRGLLFVPDRSKPDDALEIIAADSTTITVAGNVGSIRVGREFGIIYGQMLRDVIVDANGEGRLVRFFAPELGYTDAGSPATGICQVCHLQTNYWKQNGAGATHAQPQDCASCHKPAEGFKPTNHNHTGLANSVGCANCHTTDIVTGVHKSVCTTCHSSTRPEVVNAIAARSGNCVTCHGAYFYSHKNANTLHASKVVYTGTSCTSCHAGTVIVNAQDPKNHRSCSLCHDSNGTLVGSASGRQGLSPNICTDCHRGAFEVLHPSVDHSSFLMSGTTECARCHDPNHNANHLTVTHKNNCALCHNSQGQLIGKAVNGAGDCVRCHGSLYFYSHRVSHSLKVYSSIDPLAIPVQPTTCADCHDPMGAADIVADVHNNNCAKCHDIDGYLKSGSYGAGNCYYCHGIGYFPLHRPPDHLAVSSVPGCTSCHRPDGTPSEIIFFVHKNRCSSCHYVPGGSVLIGSAANNVNGSNCTTCHVGYTPSHFNAPPVAVADALTVNEGGSKSLLNSGAATVLANDTDADNDPLTAVLDTQPTSGLLTFNADGTFNYVHDGSETSVDSFSYHAFDGNNASNIVVVTITILRVNDAPVATADAMTVAEGGTVASLTGGATTVLANDTDIDGDALTALLVAPPTNGALTLNPNGTFSYIHNGSETTTDSFTYKASDGALDSNTVTVAITVTPVNDAPVAVADSISVVEGGTIMSLVGGATSVLTNDTDAENSPLTATLVSTVMNGSLTLNANGTFIYTHNGGQTTTDSFAYKANDGALDSNIVTVAITVLPVNDPPVAAADGISVVEGGTATLLSGGAASVLANDSDPDGDALSAVLVSTVASGTLTLNSNGTFFYIHNGSETTTDSFTYKARDSQFDSNTVTVSIAITPVNDAPVAVADAITVAEGGTATSLNGGATSVLANDTDPEASPLTATLVTGPVNGSLTLNSSGTFFYTHNGGQTTTDSFTYRANDGVLDSGVVTVAITVTAVNDAPVAVADAITVAEGGTAIQLSSGAASVLANDTDADGNPLTAIIVTPPVSGSLTLNANGTFSYTHNGSQVTSDSFTYKANDGTADSNTVTVPITVSAMNDAPVAVADSITVAEAGTSTQLNGGATSVLANDTDADGDTMTAILVTAPARGSLTLNPNGTFFYTHNGGETTTDSFSYKAFDGQIDSNVVTVAITITPVNDAPVAVADSITVAEGGTATTLASGSGSVLANDTDAEASPLTAIIVTPPASGSLTLNSSGTFSYTHNGGQSVSDSFTYKANDGAADSNVVTVAITITPVNDVPVAVADSITVAEGATATTLVGGASSVLTNDTDADNDVLRAVLVTSPIRGSLTLNQNGTFSYTHNGSETTSDSFTYKANDNTADSNVVTVAITVTPVNDPPTAVADTMSAAENSSNNVFLVRANDTDPDTGDTLTITALNTTGTLGVVVNNGTSVSYTPPAAYVGSDSFTYTVTDSGGLSSSALVTVNINNLNDAPVAVADVASVSEDTANNVINVLANDTDPDAGDILTVSALNTTGTLGAVVNNGGNVSYTPPAGYVGPDSFSYTVRDVGGLVSNSVAVSITVVNVNDAPVAVADSYTVAEGATLNTAVALLPSVLANDSDVDGDPLSAVLMALPVNGSLSLAANGHFVYVHNGGQTTADSFTYRATDGSLNSTTVTVSITITAVNDAPVAVADSITVAEGGSATSLVGGATSVLTNDTDADGDILTASLVTPPANGALTLNANGAFNYTHNGGETTTDSFTYRANDGAANSNAVTVAITITAVNDAPVAVADSITVAEGGTATTLVGGATSVLTNDTDVEGSVLSATLITGPASGSVTLNPNGTFFYTHNGGEIASDSFTYVANDGSANSSVTMVSITITAVNDPPVAVADTIVLAEGGVANTLLSGLGSVLANDSDPENSPLTAILIANVTNGSLVFNPNGTFIYTHNGGQTTSDSFTYKVSDGVLDSNTVTVSITVNSVNDAPVAASETITVAEGGTATALNGGAVSVLANDTDADGDVLSAILVTNVLRGSINLNANGTFFYTHNGGETTTDSFTYKANDGQDDSNLITVNITVTPVNDAPVAVADAILVNEGATATVLQSGSGSVLANDSDAEGSPLTATVVAPPASGSLTLNANGTFSYTHDGGQTTSDSFTYKVSDGLLDSNTVTVAITINSVNDAPVAVADSIVVAEGGTANSLVGGAASVLVNDTDVDGDAMTAQLVTNAANGSLTLNPTGTFSYTHNGGETTSDSFAYRASDGLAVSNIVTVAITVTPVNDPPVAVADSMSVSENSSLNTLAVLANDIDPDTGDTKNITAVNTAATLGAVVNNGANVSYTPPAAYIGPDSFSYTMADAGGLSSTATVTISVNNVNDAPVAAADSVTVSEDSVGNILAVLANDTDPDAGDTLVVSAIDTTGTIGAVVNNGDSVSYTSPANFAGVTSFSYTARDTGGLTSAATVTVTVTNLNDAPVAVADSYTVAEGGVLDTAAQSLASVLANDTDADSDPLSAILVAAPANGSLTLNPAGSFVYTHNGGETVSDSFTYRANDGSANSSTVTVAITVNPVNDAPVAMADSIAVAEGGTATVLVGGATSVLANDADVENDPLTASVVTGPANGSLTLNTNGSFSYLHDGSQTTTDSFTYRANDGAANSNTVTVSITITPVNDAPVAVAETITVAEGGSATTLNGGATSVLANDTDADGDLLSASVVTGPANGSLTLNANGSFLYTHNAGETTTDSFTYRANDGTAFSNPVTVSITITPVNDAPVAMAETITVAEAGTATTLNGGATSVLVNDTDAEASPLTAALVAGPANGSLTLNTNGTFSYTHDGSQTTTDSFTYQASDGLASSAPVTVDITITAVNDAPVAVAETISVAEGGVATTLVGGAITVLANDTDVDGDPLSAVLIAGPANGSLTLNTNGSFSYTHNGSETTTDSFTYQATDGLANSGTVTVSISITAVNDAPVAVADGYVIGQGGTLNITAPGVLANDTDAEASPLAALLVSTTVNGTLTLNANGSFTYVHAGGADTSDSFSYRVNDGLLDSSPVMVTITIGANAAPTAVADSYSVNEDAVLTVNAATGVLANDTDPESDPLTATRIVNVANGSLTFNADGSFTYTPNANYNGADSFTYQVADAFHAGNTVTVAITVNPVNDAPVAMADSIAVAEGGTATTLVGGATSVLANDADVENDPLTASVVTGPANGSLTLNTNGTFSYTHNGGETTTDSFAYRANDGAANSNTVTVAITITPVNDAPVAAADGYAVGQGNTLNITAPGVLVNDTDAEASPLTAALVSTTANGTLTFNANGSFTYVHGGGADVSDSFTYRVNDGLLDSAPATVTITIGANAAPTAVADSYSVNEDAALAVNAATGVLANDTDPESNAITATLITNVTNGVLALSPDGSFTYTPNANFNGADFFIYQAADVYHAGNTVAVTITVNPVNDAPAAVADGYVVVRGGTLNVTVPGVLGNDSDVEASPLAAVLVSTTTNGSLTLNANGSFTYVHAGGADVSDAFTYRVNDGLLDSAPATVTITVGANGSPTAVADSYSVNEDAVLTVNAATGVLANDTDPESNPLTATLVVNVTNGALALNANGSFTYTPNANYNGADSFTYQVADAYNTGNTVMVTLTVNPMNDTPVAMADSITVAEGGSATTLDGGAVSVLANDTDVDANPLTSSVVTGPASGSLTLNIDGTFSYTHNGSETTTDSFTYRVNDGVVNSNTVTVTITVNPVNDAPVAVADSYAVAHSATLNVVAPGVLTNDTDAEASPLTASLVTTTVNGALTFNADGSFTYVHGGGANSTDSFTYRVNDGLLDSAPATVTITIAANIAPTAVADSYSVNEDAALTVNIASGVLANDTDPEGNILTSTLVANVANGTLSLAASGSFTYTPNANFSGSDFFTYQVSDAFHNGNTVTVAITVNPLNDAPSAVADGYVVVRGGTLNVSVPGVLGNDSDIEASPLAASVVTTTTKGTLTLNANGSFTYVHAGAADVSDSFTYKVNDGLLDSAPATVTITIGANGSPTGVADSYSVNEDAVLTVNAASGVLANDTDPESNPLTATLVANVTNGGLTLNAAGSFTYTPNADFNGADSFTYQVADAYNTGNTVMVSITVNPVNDAPVAVADSIAVAEGGIATTLVGGATSVLTNDTDADANPLTASVVTAPANGSLTLNTNGTFSYTHNGGETTTDSFTYRAHDGTVYSNTVTVSITVTPVNDAPTISISQPDGVGDSVAVGTAYSITYTLADPDSAATVAFYYDTDAVGLNGTAISGACATAAAGAGVTCSWDTTGMTPGAYYIYGLASDGVNPAVSAYSAGTITITSAGVAALNNWANIYTGAPANTGGTLAAGNVTVSAGTNRLLLVAVAMETGSNSTPTVSATLGGVALTQIRMTATSGREHMWMGYMKDAQIGSGAKALSVTYSNATGNASGVHVKWASYSDVNQTTPIPTTNGSNAINTLTTTATFGTTINYVANGMTVVVAANGGAVTGTLSATPAFTGGALETTNGHASRPFVTAKHTASGSYASTTTVSFSGGSSRTALVVTTLQP